MFDFTSMYHSETACRVIERNHHKLLVALVGDSLLEVMTLVVTLVVTLVLTLYCYLIVSLYRSAYLSFIFFPSIPSILKYHLVFLMSYQIFLILSFLSCFSYIVSYLILSFLSCLSYLNNIISSLFCKHILLLRL